MTKLILNFRINLVGFNYKCDRRVPHLINYDTKEQMINIDFERMQNEY